MKRICPSCKSTLSMSSNYFCESCGIVLPEELRFSAGNHRSIKKIESKQKNKKNLKPFKDQLHQFISLISIRSVILGLVLGILISVLFYLFFKTNVFSNLSKAIKDIFPGQRVVSQVTKIVPENSPDSEKEDYLELGMDIKSGTFFQYGVADYVPYETPFYLEFNDISTLEPYFGFIGGELFTLVENIKENTEPFYASFYMTKGIKSGWVILTFLKDGSLELGSYNNLFTDKIGNTLIISSDPVLIDEVKLAKSEVIKSLSMHPSIISSKPFLPDTGQVLLFKLKKDGDAIVEKLERDTLSDEFKSILKEYIDSNSPYLVIK